MTQQHASEIVVYNGEPRLIHLPRDPKNPRYLPVLKPGTNKVRADFWQRALVEPAKKGNKPAQMILAKVKVQRAGDPEPVKPPQGSPKPDSLQHLGEAEALAMVNAEGDTGLLTRWGEAEYNDDQNGRESVVDAIANRLRALGSLPGA